MIIRVNPRDLSPNEPLAEALGRQVSGQEGLTDHTVVAHWPGLDYYTPFDEQQIWTSAEWAEHLADPTWQHPFAASPNGDRRAIWHADVRLAPADRDLTGPEWSEIAHRIARTAGIQRPGDDQGCRWIALQAQPGRLDLLANLIRPDDTWTAQPHRLLALLAAESRRIETELDLISPRTGGPDPDSAARFARRATPQADAADATTQLAELLGQLADENTGPLSIVRGLVEHAAHRLGRLPQAQSQGSAHQLELIAHRLHGIQQDLDATAAALPTAPARPTPPPYRAAAAPVPPSARLAR
ncbi:hypothetical protein OG306_29445 [Streptomyces sp. NBC_01241]|uniref:hypothetical protein n=1 Tax=Streptomyces sp. NBC_01241 TaxID=2903794 RepID=UPI00352E5FC9|nr:hypothetical protein OG306_29445 [Streptomyces sp. NBC_01241]